MGEYYCKYCKTIHGDWFSNICPAQREKFQNTGEAKGMTLEQVKEAYPNKYVEALEAELAARDKAIAEAVEELHIWNIRVDYKANKIGEKSGKIGEIAAKLEAAVAKDKK